MQIYSHIVFQSVMHCCVKSKFPGAGDVWFSLNGTTYQNNSIVTLEDIGKNGDALHCGTSLNDSCNNTNHSNSIRNWFFPNGTKVPSQSGQWDFFRIRGHMVVCMHRRRGGEEGIYQCVIPDSMNVTQTLYIGVYTASTSTGKWQCLYTLAWFNHHDVFFQAFMACMGIRPKSSNNTHIYYSELEYLHIIHTTIHGEWNCL